MKQRVTGLMASLLVSSACAMTGSNSAGCTDQVITPLVTETAREQIIVQPETVEIVAIPGVFSSETRRVLVHDAYIENPAQPAVFKTVTEEILVREESQELVSTPAVFETVTEQVLVRDETRIWQYQTEPCEGGLAHASAPGAAYFCPVLVPAQYETIETRHVVSPASVDYRTYPAKYETITRQVLETPQQKTGTEVPAVYRNITVHTVRRPAVHVERTVRPVTRAIDREVVVGGGRVETRSVLCTARLTPDAISRLQAALTGSASTGVLDAETLAALDAYQSAKGLARGALTLETLDALGLSDLAG